MRGYLEAMWENQRLAQVLSSGDTPAGFEVARRSRMHAAFRSWMAVLELDTSLRGQLLSGVLVATIAESSLMVAGCENPDEVQAIIDATIEWIDRLTESALSPGLLCGSIAWHTTELEVTPGYERHVLRRRVRHDYGSEF